MPLDQIYQLSPEAYAAFNDRRKAGLAKFVAASLEQRKAAAERNMAIMDNLPPEWRELVHEYGLTKVFKLYRAKTSYKASRTSLTLMRVEFSL